MHTVHCQQVVVAGALLVGGGLAHVLLARGPGQVCADGWSLGRGSRPVDGRLAQMLLARLA